MGSSMGDIHLLSTFGGLNSKKEERKTAPLRDTFQLKFRLDGLMIVGVGTGGISAEHLALCNLTDEHHVAAQRLENQDGASGADRERVRQEDRLCRNILKYPEIKNHIGLWSAWM